MPRNPDPLGELFDRIRATLADYARDMVHEATRGLPPRMPRAKRVSGKGPKRAKAAPRRKPAWTHYDTLEISRHASAEVIAAAYKAQARRYHPDHNRTKEAQEKIRAVNVAHDILSDPAKRKFYDRSIAL